MFVPITNTPRPYAWGSERAISDLLGTTPTGEAEAELWLGEHPGCPSRIIGDGEATRSLAELTSGVGTPLPFLLKVLAAGSPLSLQAHPTPEQAAEGFARENAAGIPLDAPHRNYRDPHPKPEIVFAVHDGFEALCGFRPTEESATIVRELGLSALDGKVEDVRGTFEWLITRGTGVDQLIDDVTALAAAGATEGLSPVTVRALEVARLLADTYPGDPGIVISVLLNQVTLSRGEVLFLPAGNIHAYLNGLAIEVMAPSDNVLRGGLTPKHVDVPELLAVLDFTPVPAPYLEPTQQDPRVFSPAGVSFELVEITADAEYTLTRDAIALCTSGQFTIEGADGTGTVSRGDTLYISADEQTLRFTGAGELFLAAGRH